jgi:hypothetical protein
LAGKAFPVNAGYAVTTLLLLLKESVVMNKEWKLGVDLYKNDNLLDPLTFEQVVVALYCNEKHINKRTAQKVVNEIIKQRMEDVRNLLKINLDKIVEMAQMGGI